MSEAPGRPAAVPAPPAPGAASADGPAVQVVTVVEERLDVVTRRVEAPATLRLRRRAVDREVEVNDRVVSESVAGIERVAIGRPVEHIPSVRREGDVLIVPVIEEQVVCSTRLVLVEELHLHFERVVDERPRRMSLRRLEVEVERLDPETGQWQPVDLPESPSG